MSKLASWKYIVPTLAYGGGPLCHGPHSDPKNKNIYKQYAYF